VFFSICQPTESEQLLARYHLCFSMASCVVKALTAFLLQLAIASRITYDNTHHLSKEENEQTAKAKVLLTVRQHQLDFRHQKSVQPSLDSIHVLLFVTTHLPSLHMDFLRKCWPGLISNSALLQHVDVLLFAGGDLPSDVVQTAFQGKNVRVEHYNNPGYQEGAMLAMETATSRRWFDGYDWVIRVNPDVLILDDDWLIQNLVDDGVDGIFANCNDDACTGHCTNATANSDFFAVRTSQLGPASFIELPEKTFENAESQVAAAFKSIMQNGRDRWIPGTNMRGTCRVHGHGVPVLHAHSVVSQCPLAKGQPENRNIE